MWVNNPFFFKLFVCGGGGVDKPRLRKTLQAVEGSLWLGLTIINVFFILKFQLGTSRLSKLHVTMDTHQLDTFYDYESRLLSKHVRINVLNNIFWLVKRFLTIFTLKLYDFNKL